MLKNANKFLEFEAEFTWTTKVKYYYFMKRYQMKKNYGAPLQTCLISYKILVNFIIVFLFLQFYFNISKGYPCCFVIS